jgi:putative ABC transport system permease protein
VNAILWQHWKQHPGRLALTLISMAIATATVVGALLASNSVRRAYQELVQVVEPVPTLEITAKEDGRFEFVDDLGLPSVTGVSQVIPMVFRSSLIRVGNQRSKCIVMGASCSSAGKALPLPLALGRLPAGNECVIAGSLANVLQAGVGDEVTMLARRGFVRLRISGIADDQAWLLFARDASVLMPLEPLQQAFGLGQNVDRLRILMTAEANRDEVRKQISQRIPSQWSVHLPENRLQIGEEMLKSTNVGLLMACGMAVVMAAFIVLNAARMHVAEHRRHYSILRCIGATEQQIRSLVLRETVGVGLCGAGLGIAGGYYVGQLLSTGLAAAVQTNTPEIEWDLWSVIVPGVLIPTVGVLAAWIPTRQAGKISPLEGFREGNSQAQDPFPLRLVIGGLLAWSISLVILSSVVGHRMPAAMAVPAGLITLLAYILWLPLLVPPLTKLFVTVFRGPALLATELACDSLMRRQTRTALTAGVMVVALSGSIGLGHALSNNIDEVRRWFARTMSGDLFVNALGETSVDDANDPLRQGLLTDPDIQSVDSLRFLSARANDLSVTAMIRDFPDTMEFPSVVTGSDATTLRERLNKGEILISHVLANRLGVRVTDSIRLVLQGRTFEFRVAGLTQDFWQGGMVVMLQRQAAQQRFLITGADLYIVAAREGQVQEVAERLRQLGAIQGATVQSLVDIKASVEGMLQRVAGSLWTVILMTFVASGVGVANTLAMSIREQMGELGLMRIIGMTRSQLLSLVLAEAWLLCLLGTILGTIAGITSAFIMQQCNEPLLGYRPLFQWHAWLFVGSIAMAFLVATLAVIRPARLVAQMNLLESITYE